MPIASAASRQDRNMWPLFVQSFFSHPRSSIHRSRAFGDMARHAGVWMMAFITGMYGPVFGRLCFAIMAIPIITFPDRHVGSCPGLQRDWLKKSPPKQGLIAWVITIVMRRRL